MKKYAMMLAAAALIAAAPVYYAMTAQAGEKTGEADRMVEMDVDCAKATLDSEAVPAECAEMMTQQVEPAAGDTAQDAQEPMEPKAE